MVTVDMAKTAHQERVELKEGIDKLCTLLDRSYAQNSKIEAHLSGIYNMLMRVLDKAKE